MVSWQILTPVGDEHLPAWRDINKDGYISAQEKSKTLDPGTTATEILFHNGKFADHGSSIGCQVMAPATMQAFIAEVGEGSSFNIRWLMPTCRLPEGLLPAVRPKLYLWGLHLKEQFRI